MERAPAAAAAAFPWFRVSVDLRRYFTDARARIYLLVPGGGGGGRRVAWLSRRLRRRLGAALAGPHALSVDGRALPPREPLALLQPADEIMVTPIETDCFPSSEGEVSDIEEYEILQQKNSSNTSNLLENYPVNLFHTMKRKHSDPEQRDILQECGGTSAESTTEGDYVDGAEQLRRVKLQALSLLDATTVAVRPDKDESECHTQINIEPCEPLVVESDKLAEPWNTKNLEHERSVCQPRAGRRRRVRRRPRRTDPGSVEATLELETTEGSEESAAAAAAARPGRRVRAL